MSDRSDAVPSLEVRRFAHDLLQPVAIVQAVLAAMRTSESSSGRMHDELSLIENEVRAMAEMCQRQLDLARPPVEIDLAALITAVVERMGVGYGGDIDTEISATPPWSLRSDEVEWERSLVNLIENACRAAGPDGKVVVSMYGDVDVACVSVGDSGPGFGASAAGRSSLGLVTVSQLVDRHGGHLELRRSSLGGAQVTIVIPAPGTATA